MLKGIKVRKDYPDEVEEPPIESTYFFQIL